MENLQDKARSAVDNAAQATDKATHKVADAIDRAKDALPNATPTPPGLKPQSSVHDLKSRLEWGEPALTILDARDRDSFNASHITGAMSMPMDVLVDWAKSSLEPNRDIYVYGSNEQETAQAAQALRGAGFFNVAELKGGLEAWKAVAGPTDGAEDSQRPPGPEGYNVISAIANHTQKQEIDFQ
ncbi:MAG TPA: rhodanese-like domain-containing protein [Allocoleopsis sp.]